MGLTESNIEITHKKGKATEALSSDAVSLVSKVGSFVFLASVVFYFVLFAIQVRSMAIGDLESSGNYTGLYEYLSKSRPFYVPQEKWNSIRIRFIEKRGKAELYLHSADIEKHECYRILNQDKPKYISDDEWESLKDNTKKSLVDLLTYSIKTSSIFSNLEKYFTINKPKYFPDSQWKEIVEQINKNFIVSKKLNERFFLYTEEILKELNTGKPNGISNVVWDEYKEYLVKRYYEIVCKDILREMNPLTFFHEIDLSILNKEKQNYINNIAYKIQLING